MAGYILQRVISALVVLWLVATSTFWLMHLLPGGPYTTNKVLPEAIVKNINARYKLDQPVLKQYREYMQNILKGDFGPTFSYAGRSVNDLIRSGLPKSAAVGLLAALLALCGGLGLGICSARWQKSRFDYLNVFLTAAFVAVPSFVLATLAQYIIAYKLNLLPVLGWGRLENLILPALVLSAYPGSQICRLMRASMLDVLNQDYIRTARSKGLSEGVIVLRHGFRNALSPIFSQLGPFFAYLLTGNFVVELVFNIPGIGQYFVNGVINRDYPTIMGVTLVYCFFLLVFNLLADLLHAAADPRIRLAGKSEVQL